MSEKAACRTFHQLLMELSICELSIIIWRTGKTFLLEVTICVPQSSLFMLSHVTTNTITFRVSHFMFSSLPYLHSHPDDIPPPLVHEHSVLKAELDRVDRPFEVVLQAQEPNIASMGSGQSRALIRKILCRHSYSPKVPMFLLWLVLCHRASFHLTKP
jgi:hypothetical protein